LYEAVVNTLSLLLPSTIATVNDTAIGAVGLIPPPLPSTTTAITTVDNRYCRSYTVDDKNHQKPVVVVCC
jgi:hypothetical protein